MQRAARVVAGRQPARPPRARRRRPGRARRRRGSSRAARARRRPARRPAPASRPRPASPRPAALGSSSTATGRRAARSAPGAGEADDPAADDDRVVTALLSLTLCLRRHYPDQVQTVGGLDSHPLSPWLTGSRSLRCTPPRRAAAGTTRLGHNRTMSLAPPEAAGPLRRERLRTARLYFVCEAPPARRGSEPLLRAALDGGVDIVQLREKELAASEIERSAPTFRRLCDTYSALFIVNDDPELARACNADGVHVGQDDMPAAEARRAARAGGDRRPLDPLRGAARRRRPARRSTTSASARSGRRRPKRAAPASGSGWSRTPPRMPRIPSSRSAASTPRTPARWSRPARGGSASCARSATPRTRPPRRRRCARALAAVGEAAPGG